MNKDNPTTKHHDVILYGDGGSRGNPGPAASGFVIYTTEMDRIYEGGNYLGITTNNQAEYDALKAGLLQAQALGAKRVSCFMDSQLVVNQMNGVYKVKHPDIIPVHASIKKLATTFEEISFAHVRREFNKDADAMVNKILDEHAND